MYCSFASLELTYKFTLPNSSILLVNWPVNKKSLICDCIQFYAVKLGYSYEELNIVIFVILQPALIIYLLTLCVMLNQKD